MSLYEVLDELEAGELSVEFEGREPQELLEWALDRPLEENLRFLALELDRELAGLQLVDQLVGAHSASSSR